MMSLNGAKLEKYLGMAIAFFTLNLTTILNYLNNGTEDKVWLDNSCEKYRVKATTALRRVNTTVGHMKEDRFQR